MTFRNQLKSLRQTLSICPPDAIESILRDFVDYSLVVSRGGDVFAAYIRFCDVVDSQKLGKEISERVKLYSVDLLGLVITEYEVRLEGEGL